MSSLVTLFLLPWAGGAEVGAQLEDHQGNRYDVSVSHSRPLAEAIRILEDRHRIVITYEDPPYRHESQRVNRSVVAGQPSFSPRGGRFRFEYVLPVRPSATTMMRPLTDLLDQYYTTGYAGRFQLAQTRDMFHVVPTSRRSEDGDEVAYEAILSVELPFLSKGIERTAYEALEELAGDLQRSTGMSIKLGTIPTNLLIQSKVIGWAGIASARSELIRILAGTGRRVSWRLLYGPNDLGSFVLNLHIIETR